MPSADSERNSRAACARCDHLATTEVSRKLCASLRALLPYSCARRDTIALSFAERVHHGCPGSRHLSWHPAEVPRGYHSTPLAPRGVKQLQPELNRYQIDSAPDSEIRGLCLADSLFLLIFCRRSEMRASSLLGLALGLAASTYGAPTKTSAKAPSATTFVRPSLSTVCLTPTPSPSITATPGDGSPARDSPAAAPPARTAVASCVAPPSDPSAAVVQRDVCTAQRYGSDTVDSG